MFQKNVALLPLFACSLLLIMGALEHQPHFAPPTASASFIARSVAINAEAANLTPSQTLAHAAAALAPHKVPWLRVNTWQKQVDPELSFEANGRLVCGPNQCAHLEVTVQAGPKPTTIVTVCDGVALARACSVAGRSPEISTTRLTSAQKPMPPREVNALLDTHGCGGPHCLLKDLERSLVNLQAARGAWKGKPVIRLIGSVKEATGDAANNALAALPRTCHVYLDAQTLWPHRVEWWTETGPVEPGFLFLELEFRDPDTSPLSEADCIREFTYQPE